MKERGPWRLWSTFLLFLAGNLCNSIVLSQNYEGARGDSGDSNPAPLGFDGVLARHDGYVKGETPTIPQTSFSCSAQPYNPGLYADTETQCQVYHVCFEDRQESFLCGPGTNFNQRILACDFWYNFDCSETPNFYSANADIGKVPDRVFSQGGARVPLQPQQPRYPQQPAQPPSVGSYPPRVSVPPPPAARPSQPPPPPRIQPQEPIYPQIPQEPIQPQPPRVVPQPPRIQPQPPRVQPPAVAYPPPPAPVPQPRPDLPRVPVQPQYPRVPQGSGQPANRRPPPPQFPQQEEDNGYQFDGYNPSRPSLPPPPPPRVQPPRHEFPPSISPPRVSRPPLTPPIIRQPEISRPRPAIGTRTDYHPDAEFKGSAGYRPPQQPPRQPQPSQPVGSGYPSYPVAQRPVAPRPVAQRPVVPRPVAQIPVAPRPVAQIPVAPRPVAQRPVERPSRPAYQPPQTVQQEHVDTEYVPPPPPPRPIEPSRPSTTYVPPPPPPPRVKEPSRPSTPYVPPPPPPPPPVQQEVTIVRPPPPVAQRPAYVPPPVIQRPVDNDYNRPQPPIAPSVIREQQKPAIPPPSRPQVSTGSRQPQRPKPVFPPASDHPNSNIKGGPGYNQPPPQIPRFEPTRISRPSSPQGGYEVPAQAIRPRPVSTGTSTAVKQTGVKTPAASGQAIYKPPQQERVKKPSEPPRAVYQPPIQVIDHPQVEIKGVPYDPPVPQTPQRVQSPSTSVVGVKRPQATSGVKQPQRPRAPVVVSRPQPPSFPATNIKTISPVDNQVYEKPRPQPPAPSRVKQPSISQVQTVSRPNEPRFPIHDAIDHPNANVKGGSGYIERRPQPIAVSRPSSPPSSPSTSYEQKTTSVNQGRGSGSGYPSYPSRGDIGSIQQIIKQQEYKPIRTSPPSSIKTAQKITAVKDSSSYQRPPEVHQHTVLINKQSKPDYEAGASYTRGPETYPKPEFGKPHTPVSTPSRANTKTGSPSQNTITRSQNKPSVIAGSVPSVSVGSGSGSDIRPDLPIDPVPGYQPPYQRQVFPHRENPDHPNESIKGSGAYRPPPPAGYQAAASEVEEQKIAAPEPEPAASLHGDTGSE